MTRISSASVRCCLTLSILVIFIWYAQSFAWAEIEKACQTPPSLRKAIEEKYPEYEVIDSSLLRQKHRAVFRAEHGKACPGIVKVDFFGSTKSTIALALAKLSAKNLNVKLVVATAPHKSGSWSLRELDQADLSTAPVIWSEPPGTYKNARGDQSIEAKYPVVLFVGYEAWAIVYSWTGTEVVKVWVAD